jgi:hypothetical protein
MSKASKQAAKVTGDSSVKTGEFETKFFTKSGSPKTVKETIQLVLNLFLNLFS